jgi:predicted aspartyl protease
VSRFQREPPKRDREGELNPVALPEGKPPLGPVRVVPSAVKRQVTEFLLTIEIEGEMFEFVVDTGATVS